jgi:hypothetical protein
VDDRDAALHQHERALRRAGLPTLIEDYSAAEDVFTRALPLFALVYLAEILNAPNESFGWWNVGAVAGGAVVAVVSFGLVNMARGRPFGSVPTRMGLPELAAFVLLPTLLPLAFGFQWRSALVTAAANLALIGLVYLVIGFGVIPIVVWVGGRFAGQLRSSVQILIRAVPILVFFALIVFFAAEVWQVFASLSRWRFALGIGVFVGLGALFLGARAPAAVRELEAEAGSAEHPLTRRQRINVGLVVLLSYGLQVLFVSLAVGVFFILIGAVLMEPGVQAAWTGDSVHPLRLARLDLFLTEELLRVAVGMAAISGLYYAVALVVDPAYRDELVGGLTEELRRTFQERAAYLRLRAEAGA